MEDDDEGAAGVDGNDEDSKLSQAELDKVAVSLYLWFIPAFVLGTPHAFRHFPCCLANRCVD